MRPTPLACALVFLGGVVAGVVLALELGFA